MTRTSNIITDHDDAGDYEVEQFDSDDPKRIIVGLHGIGVRRWDGENFFYAIAEHYTDSVVFLVDQNQPEGDVVKVNTFPISVERINKTVELAKSKYPDLPLVIIAHSFGCGVATRIDTSNVSAMVLVTPTIGKPEEKQIKRYGPDIVNGMTITSSDGYKKHFPAEFQESVKGIDWKDEYSKLVKRYAPVYVYEAGEDEIIGPERQSIRDVHFTKYDVIPGARHNLTGKPLEYLFSKLGHQI